MSPNSVYKGYSVNSTLPACIDPDAITATVDQGILRIVAKKATVATAPVTEEVKVARPVAA